MKRHVQSDKAILQNGARQRSRRAKQTTLEAVLQRQLLQRTPTQHQRCHITIYTFCQPQAAHMFSVSSSNDTLRRRAF